MRFRFGQRHSTRRELLPLSVGLLSSLAEAQPAALGPARASSLETRELSVPGAAERLKRVLVVLPVGAAPDSLPILVLLHGLGETRQPRLGMRAWHDLYGLPEALGMLARAEPPARSRYLSEDELAALATEVQRGARGKLCLVCPFMPNFGGPSVPRSELHTYAGWLARELIPAVRAAVPEARREPRASGIAGVSLGGWTALEAFLRHPDAYSTLGMVQGAFGVPFAPTFAQRAAEVAARKRIYVATSSSDPYQKPNQIFARALQERQIDVSYVERKGPHNQDWLRQIGTLDLLLWHERALNAV